MSDPDEDQFDGLPSDPEEGFAIFEKRQYNTYRADIDNDNRNWSPAARDYVNAVLGYAMAHDLDMFEGLGLPPYDDNEFAEYFHKFQTVGRIHAVKFGARAAAARRMIDNSIVILDPEKKKAIHRLIQSIRVKLEQLPLNEGKRESLFNKLNAFEAELDRNRTKTEGYFAFVVDLGQTARKVGFDMKPFGHALDHITDLIDSGRKLIESVTRGQKQLEGPRKQLPKPDDKKPDASDYGDDIPF